MSARATLAVVGGSLAGVRAAEGARDAGFEGRIVVVGDEDTAPYARPPLSKAVLRGEDPPESARLHPDEWYRDLDVELVADRAERLDTITRSVGLAGGDELRFDRLVVATGASPRRLTVPGADLDGVHHLRTLDDAVRLRDAIRVATRVAVVGAGWIGSEVAADARQVGADVVVVDPGEVPLQRVLGDRLGGLFRDLHRDHGVELRPRATVAELRGTKTVEAVVLDDGRAEPADVVVAGIGVLPRTELAEEAAGLRVQDGIVVDQCLETSVHGI
ncbi:MAG TPA: NAD(P)/FAD-dependent oxidoreductase, partial [Acidimicrobiales bacterium]|nr:NAD(P)/FAD-dependent oxidoreductase [Acidimicrobiales bacterium]